MTVQLRKPRYWRRTAVILLQMGIAGSLPVLASEPSRADRIVQIRQAAMTVQSAVVPALAAMANGKAPYEPKRALLLAQRAAMLAVLSSETFADESRYAMKSMSRPEVWSQRSEFNQLMSGYVEKTAALLKAAEGTGVDTLRPAVAEVSRTCRSCHEKFEEMP
ncbi:MAG: cytochrome c [Steroidobacteraceae bacterium]